jgi:hypothetical protein
VLKEFSPNCPTGFHLASYSVGTWGVPFGGKADHSLLSGAKDRNKWRYTSTLPHASHGVQKNSSLIPYIIRPTRKDIFPIQALYKSITETKDNTPLKYAMFVTKASVTLLCGNRVPNLFL